MITGLQTLRIIALAAGGGFFILVLPSTLVASGHFFRLGPQLPAIALVILGAAAAAVGVRFLQLRYQGSPGSAEELALLYRTRFLSQVAVAQVPGFLAFLFSVFARPFPGLAVLLGVVATALLVWSVAPTARTLDRLQDEARAHQLQGDVLGVLDQLYSWRP